MLSVQRDDLALERARLRRQLAVAYQRAGLGIGEDEPHPLGGILRVERHVGSAGFEDGKQRHMRVQRARQPKPHIIAAPHSPAPEKPRQLVGPALQLAIAQVLVLANEGGVIGASLSLLLEQLVQQLGTHQVRVPLIMNEVVSVQTTSR